MRSKFPRPRQNVKVGKDRDDTLRHKGTETSIRKEGRSLEAGAVRRKPSRSIRNVEKGG